MSEPNEGETALRSLDRLMTLARSARNRVESLDDKLRFEKLFSEIQSAHRTIRLNFFVIEDAIRMMEYPA